METIIQNLFFNLDDLKMIESPFGTRFSLKECSVEGKTGAPAFPVKNINVALPPNTRVTKLTEKIVTTKLVSEEPMLVACIQPPMTPGQHTGNLASRLVMPDEELYNKSINGPLTVMGGTTTLADIPVVSIAVSPMRYVADGKVEFIEHLILEVTLAADNDSDRFTKPFTTRRQHIRERLLVRELTINPDLVDKFLAVLGEADDETDDTSSPLKVDYLIITDNNKWDARTMTITGPAGDLTSEFKRLAKHKESRGYRVQVAKIKDIVEGKYGDFKTNARDLQEVIRNFIKRYVFPKYGDGVEWLLLGGDVSIIPPRLACGSAWGKIEAQDNGTGAYLKAELPDDMWVNVDHEERRIEPNNSTDTRFPFIVTNYTTGERIPFDADGTSNAHNPGWYFCSNKECTQRETIRPRTRFIRINGLEHPKNVNRHIVCYVYENMIPTDLYYASVSSHLYNREGFHDWDALDNGLYGQHTEENPSLGGIDFKPNISVGRAPVESKEEARIFVDKVIEYDNWGTTHPPIDNNRFKKMLYAAEHWTYFRIIKINENTLLERDHFTFFAEKDSALIRNRGFIDISPDLQIRTCQADDSKKILPYNTNPNSNSPGWYFAKDNNDLTPSQNSLSHTGINVYLPIPTEWIVVKGKLEDMCPLHYEIDREGVDGSIEDQEDLLEWMHTNFPRINQVQRLYSDISEMPTAGKTGAKLANLSEDNIEKALNDGPHFVSITGHGWWRGVANLSIEMAQRLTNGNNTFVAFADSCYTNEIDQNDTLGECLILHKGGGAAAYIGNTRFGWIGIGKDFRLEFFKSMKYFRHIGHLNDSRCYLIINTPNASLTKLWTVLVQTLLGDPEMNVYRDDQDAIPRYVGNKKTKQLHQSTCQWAEKYMANWNKEYFSSIEEGLYHGFDGCYYCLREYDGREKG